MKVIKWLDKNFEEFLMVLLLCIFSIAMIYSVFMRYVLNAAPSWSEEFCRYCYIWSVALSLGFCVQRDSAMKMSVVMDFMPVKVHNFISIFTWVLQLAMYGAMDYAAFLIVKQVMRSGQTSTTMGIPMVYIYVAFLLGFTLACIRCVQRIINSTKHFNEKQLTTLEQTILDAENEARMAAADFEKSEEGGTEK